MRISANIAALQKSLEAYHKEAVKKLAEKVAIPPENMEVKDEEIVEEPKLELE